MTIDEHIALGTITGPAALAQEPAHTDHPARHFDRTCPACAQADILARYSLDDGRREWVNVGTWLYPGEVIAHMDGAALAQEPAAPVPMEPQDARAWWRPSVLPECGPCVTMCRDEADSWLMQGLAAHPLYDAAAIASARRETLKRAAWLAIERPGYFSSFAKAEEFAAALRAMNDGEG